MNEPFLFKSRLWKYKGNGSWFFLTIEKEIADQIKAEYTLPRRGFGSIPVKVKIGKTEWKTSVFPDKNKTFLLPVKKSVRSSESIEENDECRVRLDLQK